MTDQEWRAREQYKLYLAQREAGEEGAYPLGACMAAHPAKLRDDFRRRMDALLMTWEQFP